jgi:hypothetical protein
MALEHADGQAADYVDEDDNDTGNSITFDELAGTIHGSVEIRLHFNGSPSPPGLVLGNQTGVHVGVKGHLIARHRIERESGGHFGDTTSTVGDDDELDNNQDYEDYNANDIVATDHELAEGFDDISGVSVKQYQPRGRDVQCQSE